MYNNGQISRNYGAALNLGTSTFGSTESIQGGNKMKRRRQIGGSISNKANKAKKLAALNKSNEILRPQELINTQNNIIIISNHTHNKSLGHRKYKERKNLTMLFNQPKKKPKIQDLLNAPYLKLPGSSSVLEDTLQYSSSRKGMNSNNKRKNYHLNHPRNPVKK